MLYITWYNADSYSEFKDLRRKLKNDIETIEILDTISKDIGKKLYHYIIRTANMWGYDAYNYYSNVDTDVKWRLGFIPLHPEKE